MHAWLDVLQRVWCESVEVAVERVCEATVEVLQRLYRLARVVVTQIPMKDSDSKKNFNVASHFLETLVLGQSAEHCLHHHQSVDANHTIVSPCGFGRWCCCIHRLRTCRTTWRDIRTRSSS